MTHLLPPRIFVTGTNTDIGKTVVSAVLLAGTEGYYWKPVQTGIIESSDTDWIREHTGLPEDHFYPETYRFQQPLSPHAAAALEEAHISLDKFVMPELPDTEVLIVEGAGGILVPLNETHFMLDLMRKLAIPVLIVADSELGTINHTLLSLECLRRAGLDILGVVMNGPKNPGNRRAIETYGGVTVLAEISPLDRMTLQDLKGCFELSFGSAQSLTIRAPSEQ